MRGLDDQTFRQLKNALVGDYLTFSVIRMGDVTQDILAEKTCDYFATLEAKTGKPFGGHLGAYMDAVDAIVGPRIAKRPPSGKGSPATSPVPRARRYYDMAPEPREVDGSVRRPDPEMVR